MNWRILFLLLLIIIPFTSFAGDREAFASVYPEKINDRNAVYLTSENFNVTGNGLTDDAPALQAAIDLARKKSGDGGIVFIPSGTYRIGKTVHLWRGIRLIGYGKERPVFKLAENTPGFQDGERKYMLVFSHNPPENKDAIQRGTWVTSDFQDGTFTTFYSGIDNINFEIADGNPAAIAVRYHIAQVCALKNIDFNIGNGLGAVEEMGSIIENCTFRGGNFGIKTGTSAPGWQCMVLDCLFEGQNEAALITNRAQMLVIRTRVKNARVGIRVPHSDALFVKDCWFEGITNTALSINNYTSEELQLNILNTSFSDVPYTVRFSGRVQGTSDGEVQMEYKAPARVYRVNDLSQGLHIENITGNAVERRFVVELDEEALEDLGDFPEKDMPGLPGQDTWVNVADLGAVGDGKTDCTEIIRQAIRDYDALYFPMGKYLLSNTLFFKEKTTFIGFHPNTTKLVLGNHAPGYDDVNQGKPLLITPPKGKNGISGIGFDLGENPGAIGVKWMAGAGSYFNGGQFREAGRSTSIGVGQKHSIWVTDGGSGIFKNLWILDRRTSEPFFINNTTAPGTVYEVSIEHHQNVELKMENVANWEFHALQLEEDRGCEKTLGIYMKDCRNILFSNFRSHRTSGVWEPYHTAIRLNNSENIIIRGNNMRGAVFPWDNALFDEVTGALVPNWRFTKLTVH
ncbi:MAG: glycosyl hydrolase family 28-related protein [Draconibacterium sp.]